MPQSIGGMLTRQIARAVLLISVLLLSRGELIYASAAANWSPSFDDPTTLDANDIWALVAASVSHSDPMEEVRRRLLLALRPIGEAPAASTATAEDYCPRAHRPRGPPFA